MALEANFRYIDDLVTANPADTDDVDEGDNHLRGIKSALKANVTGDASTTRLLSGGSSVVEAVAAGLHVKTTGAPNLTNNTNAANVGTLAGAHLAVGPADLQAKASASSAAALSINSLGGNVLIGAQSGTGAVNLYDDGAVVALTNPRSMQFRHSSTSNQVRLEFADVGGAARGLFGYIGSDTLTVRNQVNSGGVALQGATSGGSNQNLLVGSPGGAVTTYYNGNAAFESFQSSSGLRGVKVSSNSALELREYSTGDTDITGLVSGSAFGGYIKGRTSGHVVVGIDGNDGSDSFTVLGTQDADGVMDNVAFYVKIGADSMLTYASSNALQTTSSGAKVLAASAGTNAILDFEDGGGNEGLIGKINGAYCTFRNQQHGQQLRLEAEQSDGTLVTLFNGDPDGRASMSHDGSQALRTLQHDATDVLSGGETLDYGGTWRQLGFLDSEIVEDSNNRTIGFDDWGKTVEFTGGSGHTFTFNNQAGVPVGVMVTIVNDGSADLTVAEGSMTLRWFNGSGSVSTGNRTLAVGGVCTVHKKADGTGHIWGSGLN